MTKRLVFDIETDGLLDQMTTIHSLVIKDADTGEVRSFCDQPGYQPISAGVAELAEAQEVIGHNIMAFDLPAIEKIYPWFDCTAKVTDTLILSRLIWSDMKEQDFSSKRGIWNLPDAPNKLIGAHGLEAWGWRLGEWKGDYSKVREQELKEKFKARYDEAIDAQHALYEAHCEENEKRITKVGFSRWLDDVELPPEKPTKEEITEYVWGSWNQSMQDYCEQDVEVTLKLLQLIERKDYSKEAMELEHDFQRVILLGPETEGFLFNQAHAEDFQRRLYRRKVEIEEEVREFFPPWEKRTKFLPKVTREDLGYEKGKVAWKTRTVIFNPGSRDHIAERLSAVYGWVPTEFTDNGKPKVDEDVLKALPYPPCPLLAEYFLITKRLGQLCEGKQAWMNNVDPDGRIRQRVVTNGAVTGRCTHKIVVNVPAVGKAEYGGDCRECFGPPKGKKQVGADLSGLELRCLAHYMALWDKGAYAKELLEGDIHTANQKAAGLPTRDNAKTFIYGFLYGAGAEKIGSIVGGDAKQGKELIKKFLEGIPALGSLRRGVEERTSQWLRHPEKGYYLREYKGGPRRKNPKYKGYLVGLDGRHLPIRHPHAALNTLLQSAGAIIAKKATVLLYDDLTTRGYIHGEHWGLMAHVHDEVQLWANPEIAEEIGKAAVAAFEAAGRHFNFRCPITGEFKIGDNWKECH